MRSELVMLRKDYLFFKNNKESTLNLGQFKQVIRLRVKLKKAIGELEDAIKSLDIANEYGSTVSGARAKLKAELDSLLLIKETI